MPAKSAFYAQSGGVTAVINASAAALLLAARNYPSHFDTVYAGQNGILGALKEELIDTSTLTEAELQALIHTPGGVFGSCRYKLKSLDENRREYERLVEVFKAHHIGYFFYNGGNDSQDTAYKVSQISDALGYPIQCIGIPKTIDNDLPITDTCPGFGSVAKYIATAVMETGLDVKAMSVSTKIFIMEVMGRHAGWIAAAAGLAARQIGEAPHLILFPEIKLDEDKFLARVQDCVQTYGYCSIVVSEGIKNQAGKFLAESGAKDAFGHSQLGGAAPAIAELIRGKLKFKSHYAIADYMQRSAAHLVSKADLDQAMAAGKAAIEFAVAGKTAVMPVIVREADSPYRWSIGMADIKDIANVEKHMPREFISADGFGITDAARRYLQALIEGEAYPPYEKGLPAYARPVLTLVEKRLPEFNL